MDHWALYDIGGFKGKEKGEVMTNEEIKSEVEKEFRNIKDAEARLKHLRSICKHEHTFFGDYSWRIGGVLPGKNLLLLL